MSENSARDAALVAALLKAQSEFPDIAKDSEADVGKYKYTYASLPMIFRAIKPVLHSNGLVITQTSFGGELVTTLWHEGGQSLVSTIEMPSPLNMSPQDWGKAHSYYRRYEVNGMLGIAPDDDTDAAGVEAPATTITDRDATIQQLLSNERELVKTFSPHIKTQADAVSAVRDLLDALSPEADDENDLYDIARRHMNSEIDSRVAG